MKKSIAAGPKAKWSVMSFSRETWERGAQETSHLRWVKEGLDISKVDPAFRIFPMSPLIAPSIAIEIPWLRELRNSGTDHVGIAIDAATPTIFHNLSGHGVNGPHRWVHYWEIVNAARDVFGHSNVGLHLIVGLGETEEEMG